jgi:hypothetical protein
MIESPTTLDHILLVMFVLVGPLAEWLWYYPRSVRAINAGIPGARMRLYRNILLPEWGFTACVIALWLARGRPWNALLLDPGTPVRFGIGLLLATLFVVLLWLQRRAIFARPNGLELVRRGIGTAAPLSPRTPGERLVFNMVAIPQAFARNFSSADLPCGTCAPGFPADGWAWPLPLWSPQCFSALGTSTLAVAR